MMPEGGWTQVCASTALLGRQHANKQQPSNLKNRLRSVHWLTLFQVKILVARKALPASCRDQTGVVCSKDRRI